MFTKFNARKLCRAGVIAALYVALTYAFGSLSYSGILQIRPAEALCILPLFFWEAVPALTVGCVLSNLASPFLLYDIFIGGTTTFFASLLTYLIGKVVKNRVAKYALGGLFPVVLNAFVIPVVIVFLCGQSDGYAPATAYFICAFSMLATQSVWVYGLGIPLGLFVDKYRERLRFFR